MTALPLPGMALPEAAAPAPVPAAARRRYEFFVAGEPKGMGSKSAFAYIPKGGGKPRAVITDMAAHGDAAKANQKRIAWKDAVTTAAMLELAADETVKGAIAVEVTFHLRRPSGHYGTGKRAGQLLPSAPRWPAVTPDIDKLVRNTLDAIKVSGLYSDDSRVVRLTAAKDYAADGKPTGAQIIVEEL